MSKRHQEILIILFLLLAPVLSVLGAEGAFMGASLYFSPLPEDPRAGNNFTITIKTDSLAQPINAINGRLVYSPDKLEIINVSKIGSVFNIWLEEPNFTNLEGKLNFQGGVPKPGFMGNGGTVLHVIFKAKSPGITSIIWEKAEVLASDGKGTNILTNLQNYDFVINEPLAYSSVAKTPFFKNPLVILNVILLVGLGLMGFRYFIKSTLKAHDEELHEHEKKHDEKPDQTYRGG